jgi:hypothetical protein
MCHVHRVVLQMIRASVAVVNAKPLHAKWALVYQRLSLPLLQLRPPLHLWHQLQSHKVQRLQARAHHQQTTNPF